MERRFRGSKTNALSGTAECRDFVCTFGSVLYLLYFSVERLEVEERSEIEDHFAIQKRRMIEVEVIPRVLSTSSIFKPSTLKIPFRGHKNESRVWNCQSHHLAKSEILLSLVPSLHSTCSSSPRGHSHKLRDLIEVLECDLSDS